jgi:hypothetical protein
VLCVRVCCFIFHGHGAVGCGLKTSDGIPRVLYDVPASAVSSVFATAPKKRQGSGMGKGE